MATKTGIEWTDSTWNPFRGCHPISPGCKNCYMFREQKRYGMDPSKIIRCKTFYDPLRKKAFRKTQKVFVCSWSDFFIQEADQWRPELWEIIKATPHLTYQILTKRPERITNCLPLDWNNGYKNVWLGVTIETTKFLDRIYHLTSIPCLIHFISFEPLLEYIPLQSSLLHHIEWVIVGGESGPNFRPIKHHWIDHIICSCQATNTPFFFKQWAGTKPKSLSRKFLNQEWNNFPSPSI